MKIIDNVESEYNNIYKYEFIPYKRIGNILLDKKIGDQGPKGQPYLNENSLNHVLCMSVAIDNPEIERRHLKNDKVFIVYNNKEIELTCYFEKLLNNLSQVCDDFIVLNDFENPKDKWKHAYSRKLGIVVGANYIDDMKEFCAFTIRFVGKDVFEEIVREYETKMTEKNTVLFDKKDKNNIKEEENESKFLCDTLDFMEKENQNNKEKYDANSENNISRKMHRKTKSVLNKYYMKPERNIPQKVYGVPNPLCSRINIKIIKKCLYILLIIAVLILFFKIIIN